MAWTVPAVRSTGDIMSGSIWNTDIVGNLFYLKAAFAAYYSCGQEVTAKTATTIYRNTTAHILVVTVSVEGTDEIAGHVEAYVEAADASPDLLVAQAYTDRNAPYDMRQSAITFAVPIGSYYQVVCTNCAITEWVEWSPY